MRVNNINLYGIYNESKLVLGIYDNPDVDYFNDEEKLLEVTKDNISGTSLVVKKTYELDGKGSLFLDINVNPEYKDLLWGHTQSTKVEVLPKGEMNLKEMLWHNLP